MSTKSYTNFKTQNLMDLRNKCNVPGVPGVILLCDGRLAHCNYLPFGNFFTSAIPFEI